MNDVRLDPQQVPARAELLLAAELGEDAPGRPIYARPEPDGQGDGEPAARIKVGALLSRRWDRDLRKRRGKRRTRGGVTAGRGDGEARRRRRAASSTNIATTPRRLAWPSGSPTSRSSATALAGPARVPHGGGGAAASRAGALADEELLAIL